MQRKRTKRFLLSIAAVGGSVGIVACGDSTAVGSVAVGTVGFDGSAQADGGEGGPVSGDASMTGTLPAGDAGNDARIIVGVGVIIHPDGSTD